MGEYFNPFEYEAANKFDYGQIVDYYIEDFNYSRFIRSKRNVFLIGERGTGKTMTLLYHSLPVQHFKAKREATEANLDVVAVYIPCKTPLMHRKEHELLEPLRAAIVSEHLLVLNTMFAIVDSLLSVDQLVDAADNKALLEESRYVLNLRLPHQPLLEALRQAIQHEVTVTQKVINQKVPDAFFDQARSFSSSVLPLLSSLKRARKLASSHFALMYDDAHDLNEYQIKALNSWISYRENFQFSFKVATAKVDQPTQLTASGGTILDGHDYVLIDMEQPFQNQDSAYGHLARQVVQKRLEKMGLKGKSPDQFFPVNPSFTRGLEEAREKIRAEAGTKLKDANPKQVSDYIYKYDRAEYFRQRSARANRPPYSGFDILVHMSTGVIRNLLEPCYWMYDRVYSENRVSDASSIVVEQIEPDIQTEIILDRSKRKWEWIRTRLDKSIPGCSREQAVQVFQLFDNLAILFRERLLTHKSEPRAITFTVSELGFDRMADLEELLRISRKAQILYARPGSAKDLGRRETYYVPNRVLWPDRGLDPVGQHARVSIRASSLWAAASENRKIPFVEEDNQTADLFDE